MEDKRIPDTAITASYTHAKHYPKNGRLNFGGGWCTYTTGGKYLQIDLGEVKTITRIATQGYSGVSYWTIQYHLEYSIDGLNWAYYYQPNIAKKVSIYIPFSSISRNMEIQQHRYYDFVNFSDFSF
jgi:hypothetical protein